MLETNKKKLYCQKTIDYFSILFDLSLSAADATFDRDCEGSGGTATGENIHCEWTDSCVSLNSKQSQEKLLSTLSEVWKARETPAAEQKPRDDRTV